MLSSIVIIQNPPFIVDFQPFIDAKKVHKLSLLKKVQDVVLRPFELIGFIFIAAAQSGRSTLGYSWISFKHNVLGYYGSLAKYRPPQDFYLVMFKVFIWACKVFWCFTVTTLRRLMEQIDPPSKTFLNTYTEGKIDPWHLWTKELSIDVSAVPAEIKVSTLREMFQKINFDEPDTPGYMTPSSRKEGSLTYEVEELKNSLDVFIKHIEGRTPFLGTPSDYDTPRLMAFYQQIEDAIRFSIHKINQEFEEFQKALGSSPDDYSEEQTNQYKNHLENLARIAIDMAIAGKHCGARYMGEALSTYFNLVGETGDNGTLQDCLIELLASKRREIAQRQAHQHMGTDTHGLSKYMASLGEPLGLPGTQNVVEHLRQSFNYEKFLKLFFREYTVDLIIDTVQEKIKKSQLFREKITDWLKDQVGDWKKDTENVEKLIADIQSIIDEKVEGEFPWESQLFVELINHLRVQQIEWPAINEWDDFLTELFSIDVAKEWFKTTFKGLSPIEIQTRKNLIKQKFKEDILSKQLAEKIKNAIIGGNPVLELINENENRQCKIKMIRRFLPIHIDTLTRVLDGKVNLEPAIKDHFNLARREEFLYALKLDNIAQQGVSPEILEWLLVSQQILLPQEMTKEVQIRMPRADENHKNLFIHTVVNGFIDSRKNRDVMPLTWVQEHLFNPKSSQTQVNQIAQTILYDSHSSISKNDAKRYQFPTLQPKDELLKMIFDESFHHIPQFVIRDAQYIEGSFYPLWKRTCLIKLPKVLGTFFGSFIIKLAISIAAFYYSYKLGNFAFHKMKLSFTAKVIPLIINNTPIKIIRSTNQTLHAIEWGLKHKFRLLIGAFGIQQLILRGPKIPYFTSMLQAINIWDMGWALYRSPQTLFSFLQGMAWEGAAFIWKNSHSLGSFFTSMANKTQADVLAIYQSKSYAVWKAVIAEKTPNRVIDIKV